MAVWIRIPSLPIGLYTAHHLWKIGNIFGRTLKVDRNSLHKSDSGLEVVTERERFARLCVEEDLRKNFLSKFKIGDRLSRKDQCSNSSQQEVQKEIGREGPVIKGTNNNEQPKVEKNHSEAFGDGMVIQRQTRGRKLKVVPAKNIDEGKGEVVLGGNKEDHPKEVLSKEGGETPISLEIDAQSKEEGKLQYPLVGLAGLISSGNQRRMKGTKGKARKIPPKDGKEKGRGPSSPLQKKIGTENKSPNTILEGPYKAASRMKENGKAPFGVKDRVDGLINQEGKKRERI
ncbi:uncharacterized protein LOC133297022 [Gastrolobium bilobum]|uniref:uncharacterized protein LOC133297022 n=1 Tax=Gastrolobium bilobum TaxID=150636 RepID=UPI002AB2842E|nr:uncharacterized protein LOC133297022 [Gastrolobium bilobum]